MKYTFKKIGQYGQGKYKTVLMSATNGFDHINYAYGTRLDKIGTLYLVETPIGRFEFYGMKKVKQFIVSILNN